MLKSHNTIELILRITVAIKFHTFQGINRIPNTFIKHWSSSKKRYLLIYVLTTSCMNS